MTEAVPEEISRALAVSDRHAYLEQRLFVLSPFGTLPTALILFTVLAASFAIAWSASGLPTLGAVGNRGSVGAVVWLGLWFSLMLPTTLGMQRYTRVKDRQDIAQYAAILRGGWDSAAHMTELTPNDARLAVANIAGLAIGLVASWFLYVASPTANLKAWPLLMVWFFLATTAVIMTFTRGVALTRAASSGLRKTIEDEVVIDLLRIDRLTVIGRLAARVSLIWFTISAVIFLVFIGGGLTPFTISFLAACAAMGIWVFVQTMEHVHRRILAVKASELERLRGEIDTVRARASQEADASVRLQGLLAYETRIAAAPEWPFDQTTLVRVGASVLILTVPWFGQAIAAYVVDHMSHIAS